MILTLLFKVKGHFQAIFGHFEPQNVSQVYEMPPTRSLHLLADHIDTTRALKWCPLILGENMPKPRVFASFFTLDGHTFFSRHLMGRLRFRQTDGTSNYGS